MSVNNIGGQNVYDPSRRIKAAFGVQEAADLHAEAVARMTQAMNSNAIRNRTEYVDNSGLEANDRIADMVKNIKHTNPRVERPNIPTSATTENGSVNVDYIKFRGSCLGTAYKNCEEMNLNENTFDKILKNSVGVTTKSSTPVCIEQLGRLAGKNVLACIVTNSLDTTFETSKNVKATTGIAAAATIIDSLTTTALAGNQTRIKNIFDTVHMTPAELQMVRKVGLTEKLKYGLQHAVASVVIPSAIKYGINKTAPESLKNNKAFKYATSFGVLSELGKFSLHGIRKVGEKKLKAKMVNEMTNVNLPTTNNEPCKAYKTIAKYAVNHIINESIDDTFAGTVIGSVLGYSEIEYESGGTNSTVKAIANFQKNAATPAAIVE